MVEDVEYEEVVRIGVDGSIVLSDGFLDYLNVKKNDDVSLCCENNEFLIMKLL